MAKYALEWDKDGERTYETGVKQCALYVKSSAGYGDGVAWNGITGITETPSGADITKLYANDKVYLNLQSLEEFGGTIEAYTYPDEFAECDGSATVGGMLIGQQPRKEFGLAYMTTVGNDTSGTAYGSKLHLVYGCRASVSDRSYATINDSPEAITFSWTYETTPVTFTVNETEYTASLITVEKTTANATKFESLLKTVYGDGSQTSSKAKLPTPSEVYSALNAA